MSLELHSRLRIFMSASPVPTCSICIEPLTDKIKELHKDPKLKLTHSFHEDCINKWLSLNKTCPICREKITVIKQPTDITAIAFSQFRSFSNRFIEDIQSAIQLNNVSRFKRLFLLTDLLPEQKMTLLHQAVLNKNFEIVKEILKPDRSCFYPKIVEDAIDLNQFEIVNYIVSNSLIARGHAVDYALCKNENIPMALDLLRSGLVDEFYRKRIIKYARSIANDELQVALI